MFRNSYSAVFTTALGLYCSPFAQASAALLQYSIEPRLLETEFVPLAKEQLQEARFKSGLGLALHTPLLQASLDYRVSSLLRNEGALDDSRFSQSVGASVRSALLNELLRLDAGIDAHSHISDGGDAYQYKILPGFSTSLTETAKVTVQYQYQMGKDINQDSLSERRGYLMDLSGSLQNGRLRWNGSYRSASDYKQQQLQLSKSTERLSFNTRYRVASDLELEVSRALKQQVEYAGTENEVSYEKSFGAGLAWSPSAQYSLALRVNQREDSRFDGKQIFGSGHVSWFPRRNLSVSVDYGEQQVAGVRGVIVSTQLKLDSSY